MTKEKLDASVKRQWHARGVSLIKYFDRARTTSIVLQVLNGANPESVSKEQQIVQSMI